MTPASRENSGTRRRLCLPTSEWPAEDQKAWARILRTGDILDDAGPAAHWAPATRHKYWRGYGRWIRFLGDSGWLDEGALPEDRVTRDAVSAYLDDLVGRAPYTIIGRVAELHAVISAIAPTRDWRWLREVISRLRARGPVGGDKSGRIVHSARLYEAGVDYMNKIDGKDAKASVMKATRYRDGLIVALLAARPIRLRNLAMIRIGRHLKPIGDGYVLAFDAGETKTKRPLEVPVPVELVDPLLRYLDHYRPRLLNGANSDRLWITQYRIPMSESCLYGRIVRVTQKLVGVRINPHLFRDCAATTLAIEDPDHVRMIAPLLGHTTLRTAEIHYNQARSLEASRLHQKSVIALRRRRKTRDRRAERR